MSDQAEAVASDKKIKSGLGPGFLVGTICHAVNAGASAVAGVTWLQLIGFTQFFYVVPIALAVAISKRNWGFVKGISLAALLLLFGNVAYLFMGLAKTGTAH